MTPQDCFHIVAPQCIFFSSIPASVIIYPSKDESLGGTLTLKTYNGCKVTNFGGMEGIRMKMHECSTKYLNQSDLFINPKMF